MPNSAIMLRNDSARKVDFYQVLCKHFFPESIFSIANPARIASGFPSVPPDNRTGRRNELHYFFLPPYAPTGKPPIIFPNVVKSGVMPNNSCAPPGASRNPSLLHRKLIPFFLCCRLSADFRGKFFRYNNAHISYNRFNNYCGNIFLFSLISFSTDAILLYCAFNVREAMASGTPDCSAFRVLKRPNLL